MLERKHLSSLLQFKHMRDRKCSCIFSLAMVVSVAQIESTFSMKTTFSNPTFASKTSKLHVLVYSCLICAIANCQRWYPVQNLTHPEANKILFQFIFSKRHQIFYFLKHFKICSFKFQKERRLILKQVLSAFRTIFKTQSVVNFLILSWIIVRKWQKRYCLECVFH